MPNRTAKPSMGNGEAEVYVQREPRYQTPAVNSHPFVRIVDYPFADATRLSPGDTLWELFFISNDPTSCY
ncbi:hypothetical protein KQX54_018536 [Cotesia glomerata]|uniref:Uncharacterized protein n=1 Tax=Cotesia glomerata TaxID=32391 RepID=A0AAV7HYG9_COTGL|nr:hypothetical protein KQX54_018536 [Cotesia glomerata]